MVCTRKDQGELTLSEEARIARVTVVGCGLIGASWSACFLANGLEVSATDVDPEAESRLCEFIDQAWPTLKTLGLASNASPTRLSFHRRIENAIEGTDFVQENAPERELEKIKVFTELDRLLPPDVVLASSSSGLLMSRLQIECSHPDRCVIGHPFNPPHLMPLVEVVGGEQTSRETIARAMRFYTSLGKHPIWIRKEKKGHVANRLQAALLRECLSLVEEGVVDVQDADAAVSYGPGLRWALMGPCLVFHLAGGKGGIHHYADHLMGPLNDWWSDLGNVPLSPQLQEHWIRGVMAEAGEHSVEQLERRRDQLLLKLLQILKTDGQVIPGRK